MSGTQAAEAPHLRSACETDLREIVRVHQAAFPGFFMTLLGPAFLEAYYRLVLHHPGKVFYVWTSGNRVRGFAAGCLSPSAFYQELRRHRLRFFLRSLPSLMFHPSLVRRLVASYLQSGRSTLHEWSGACELSSIAVDPEVGGQGIGGTLLHGFVAAIQDRATSILLTTDAENNEAVNRFYRHHGFILEETLERSKGRTLNVYRLDLKS